MSIAFLAAPAQAAPSPYPAADGFVLDLANAIDDDQESELEDELAAYEEESGNEVAVLVVRTLGGRTVEAYGTGVFNAWGIGKKGDNNGVLLLVAMKQRKLRIEVGQGARAALDDEEVAIILDDVVRPAMRAGDVGKAARDGAAGIQRELDAGPDGDPAASDDVRPPDRYAAPAGGFEPDDNGAPDDGFGSAVGLIVLLGVGIGVASLIFKGASGAASWGPSTGRRGSGSAGIWFGGGSESGGGTWSRSAGSGSSFGSNSSTSSGSSFGGGSDSGGPSGGGDFGGGSSSGGGASGDW